MNKNNRYESKTTDDIGEEGPLLATAMKIAKFKKKFGASRMITVRNAVSEEKNRNQSSLNISK